MPGIATLHLVRAATALTLSFAAVTAPVAAQNAGDITRPTPPPPSIDTDKDGKPDAWDRDANGVADAWDADGDGKPDTFDDDGNGKPDKKPTR